MTKQLLIRKTTLRSPKIKKLILISNEHEDRYRTFENLVKKVEYSNLDDFKKLSVLVKVPSFL